jgi:parallel beta-helix repeat protein
MALKGFKGFKRFFPMEIDTTSQTPAADPLSPYYSKLTHTVATIIVAQDGSGDYESIQDGINALPPEGGIVFVKAGTYNLSSQITISKNSVYIEGIGINTIIQPAAVLDSCFLISASVVNFKITSVKFKSPYLMNNAIIDLAANASYTRISNITFESWQGTAIRATSNIHLTVTESSFISPLTNNTTSISLINSNHCIVSNNLFETGTLSYGVLISGNSSYVVVSANTFKTGYTAVMLSGGDSIINRCAITGNVMEQIGYGVWLEKANHTTVTGNTMGILSPRSMSGIYLKTATYCNIIGNSIYRSFWAIYLYADSGCVGNTIIGNSITSHHYAAITDGGTGTEISHNTLD